jgi:glycosyltransferase involved in cell wall biosynthesis
MHVMILNQTFYPDTAATAQHMWDLARHLDRRGDTVTVVSSRVYYGTDRQHEHALDRYGAHITVERVAGTRFGKNSRAGLIGRALDFLSFYLAAGAKLRSLPEPPDVVLALTSPPMISSLAAALRWVDAKLGRRTPRRVCHEMDLYPDAAVASGFTREGSSLERLLTAITARTLASADAVIALGRDMQQRILDHSGGRVDPARVCVVTPWAEGDQLRPVDKRDNPMARSLGLDDVFTVVYSGNLGIAHDLDTIARAIELTRDDPRICWLFIGGGKRFDELRRIVDERRWRHLRILPFQPREDLSATLNLADVHLVSQLPSFTGVVVPSKLFGILAVGKPAILVGPAETECGRIIAEHDAGVIVANGDAEALVAAIQRLRDDPALRRAMGARARSAFEREYDAPISCARIEEILRGTLSDERNL